MKNEEPGRAQESPLREKSRLFAYRIIRLNFYLTDKKREYIISKQVMRSGTSVGANIFEAKYGQSKPDFISKMSIALKETSETEYWFDLLRFGGYITQFQFDSLYSDAEEIKSMLISTINTAKKSLEQEKEKNN